MKSRTTTSKIPINLLAELNKIASARVMAEKDRKANVQRVMRKLPKSSYWPKLREELTIADFIDDDRGQLDFGAFAIFRFIIVAFVTVVLLAGLVYVMGLINTTFHSAGIPNDVNAGKAGYVNLTRVSDQTFGQVNNSIQALRLVAITLIFSEILFFLVMVSFKRVHPAMFMVYILIVFLAVMFSAPIANAYETLLGSNVYNGTLQSFTGTNWILLNLPMVTLFVGIIGAIFLFISISRIGNEGIIP